MKRQNEAKLLQLSTTIQNNLQKLMSSTFQRTLQENIIIKSEVSYFILMKVMLHIEFITGMKIAKGNGDSNRYYLFNPPSTKKMFSKYILFSTLPCIIIIC